MQIDQFGALQANDCNRKDYSDINVLFSRGGLPLKSVLHYFSIREILLWLVSVLAVVISFFIFDGEDYLTLCASLIGVTSLIFCAKGNFIGLVLMIVFSLLYGYISYTYTYFGEMVTYLGMTMPMSVVALVSWIRNPYDSNKSEVRISSMSFNDTLIMWLLTVIVTVAFYFILGFFNTSNLIPSTISVTTSFLAVYLSYKRSPFFALAYAFNDVILILLWSMASFDDSRCISVMVCFVAFLFNDIYGFVNWRRMKRRQCDE